jgi:hypothetical protein
MDTRAWKMSPLPRSRSNAAATLIISTVLVLRNAAYKQVRTDQVRSFA